MNALIYDEQRAWERAAAGPSHYVPADQQQYLFTENARGHSVAKDELEKAFAAMADEMSRVDATAERGGNPLVAAVVCGLPVVAAVVAFVLAVVL